MKEALVKKRKFLIILALAFVGLLVVNLSGGREAKDPIDLKHTKLPGTHPPVYINSISFAGEKETYPLGVLASGGNLLVTYYNQDKVDVFSLGGRKIGGFKVKASGKPGLPYNMADQGELLAITDFVNGSTGFYKVKGDKAKLQGEFNHDTSQEKFAPYSIYARGTNFYLTDKNLLGWLVLDNLGKLEKTVSVHGEDRVFNAIPGLKDEKRKPLVSAFGIVVTEDKRFVISDPDGAQIKVYDYTGKYLYDFEKSPDQEQLLFPRGMAVDGHGRIHAVDKKANKVFVYDNYGKFLFTYGEGQLSGPSNITVDTAKRAIFIANTEKQEISIWGY